MKQSSLLLCFFFIFMLAGCGEPVTPPVVDPPNSPCVGAECPSTPDPNPPAPEPCQGEDCPPPQPPAPPPSICNGIGNAEVIFRPVSMARQFVSTSSFESVYAPGDTVRSSFCFQLMNANVQLEQAVLRFDIVNTAGQSVLRQGNAIINTDSFSLNPDLSNARTFFSKSRIQEGVIVQGSFDFLRSAPAGEYRTVISVVPTRNDNVPDGSVAPIVAFSYPFRLE